MKKVIRYDDNMMYVEDVYLQDDEQIPTNCTQVLLPEGIYLPAKFSSGQWVTTLTQDEISQKNVTQPSEMDNLKKQVADLSYTLMMNGVL